jgi:transcriptional regulator with XRE-family HTH domain
MSIRERFIRRQPLSYTFEEIFEMAGRGDFGPSGFGERLRKARESKEWTQKELADKAGTHINTVARIERGEQEPAWPLVLAFAAALGVSCEEFSEAVVDEEPPAKAAKKKGGKK